MIQKVLITCKNKTAAKKLRKHLIKLGIDWITKNYDSDIHSEEDWMARWDVNGSRTVYCINDMGALYFGSYSLYYELYYKSIYKKYTSYTVDEFIKKYPI